MSHRIAQVAWREFISTAMTKAFFFGVLIVPVVTLAIVGVGFKFLLKRDAPAVIGQVAVIDRSGEVLPGLTQRLTPEAIAQRKSALVAEVAETVDELQERVGRSGGRLGKEVQSGVAAQLGPTPRLTVVALPLEVDAEAEKAPLRAPAAKDGDARLALAIVDEHAVVPIEESGRYGSFELFVRGKLDDRVESEIRHALTASVKDARIRAAGQDPAKIEALITVHAPRSKEITAEGERDTQSEARLFISFGFVIVLMMSVLIGGQSLLTTTVEEKSSRVVEVLLSALSPMELMTGKILGQLGVGLAILIIYGSIGGGALVLFGLGYLLGLANLIYLLVFFLLTYGTVGALLAAVGSSVNDMREAQSLQTPVMLVLMIPYLLWLPLSRDPSSTFAIVCSFIPPINSFVVLLRLTSSEPPPTWQVLASIAVSALGMWAAFWFAAKVFRIGLLMFGKPPDFRTLVRWVRMS